MYSARHTAFGQEGKKKCGQNSASNKPFHQNMNVYLAALHEVQTKMSVTNFYHLSILTSLFIFLTERFLAVNLLNAKIQLLDVFPPLVNNWLVYKHTHHTLCLVTFLYEGEKTDIVLLFFFFWWYFKMISHHMGIIEVLRFAHLCRTLRSAPCSNASGSLL